MVNFVKGSVDRNDRQLIKEHLLEAMEAFHNLCKEHNLDYFLINGTLIGAVRHKGFIPWDDDIDVTMKEDDYKKLLSLSSHLPKNFSLGDIKNNNYIYPFTKFSNDKLIVQEEFYKPFQIGVWIDVFPLGYTFKAVCLQKLHFRIVKAFRLLFILKYGSFKLEKRSKLTCMLLKLMHHTFKLVPKKLFLILFDFFEYKLAPIFSDKTNLASFQGSWGVKEVAPKYIFETKKLYEFEGKQFYSVKDYDFILNKVYGNYMEIPPIRQRPSPHIGKIIKVNGRC